MGKIVFMNELFFILILKKNQLQSDENLTFDISW